jgi:hypothetical protein
MDLECQAAPLCAVGESCCPSPDGKTAVCGECCEAADCPRDMVDCTVEKCTLTMGGTSACTVELDPSMCLAGQTCDGERGCTADQCKEAGDCADPTACKQVSCNSGTCVYSAVDCSHSQECCPSTGACQDCCSNKDCKDAGATLCCPATGTCAECCSDSDCDPGIMPAGGSAAAIGLATCSRPVCNAGTCGFETGTCPLNQKCCDGIGCVPLLQGCGVMTN